MTGDDRGLNQQQPEDRAGRISTGGAGASGKQSRLQRILRPESGRTVIVPLDDTLISGPDHHLSSPCEFVDLVARAGVDAIMAFPGLYSRCTSSLSLGRIVNVTASTTMSHHTRKVLIAPVELALRLDAHAVAVHVNFSSRYEPEMLKNLGVVSDACDRYGVPMIAIAYPRSEREGSDYNYEDVAATDVSRYAAIVRHAARVAVDLGADAVKTQYTGDPDSFASVVQACAPVPIIMAGGPKATVETVIRRVHGVLLAGGAGVSIGRNVFQRQAPARFLEAVVGLVHGQMQLRDALRIAAGD